MGMLNRRRLTQLDEQRLLLEYRLAQDDLAAQNARVGKLNESIHGSLTDNPDMAYAYGYAAVRSLADAEALIKRRQGEIADIEEVAQKRAIDLSAAAQLEGFSDRERSEIARADTEIVKGTWLLEEGGRDILKGLGLGAIGIGGAALASVAGSPTIVPEVIGTIGGLGMLGFGSVGALVEAPFGAFSAWVSKVEANKVRQRVFGDHGGRPELSSLDDAGSPPSAGVSGHELSPGL